ncbi:MAG: hypothetical protein JXK94_11515 [Deltaproteobacteria bacterium]|nr:hypothetical protein [Deltaproteobacteria bacterium]
MRKNFKQSFFSPPCSDGYYQAVFSNYSPDTIWQMGADIGVKNKLGPIAEIMLLSFQSAHPSKTQKNLNDLRLLQSCFKKHAFITKIYNFDTFLAY